MKRIVFILLIIFMTSLGVYASMNNQNVQAPVYPQGEACASQEATRIQFQYKGIPLDEIIDYYKSELKDEKDIKWETMQDGNGVIIHDWGSREWHKIKIIDRADQEGVFVSIYKNSWTWIVGTLVIRFIGVFVVLLVLLISMYISGGIISRLVPEPEK